MLNKKKKKVNAEITKTKKKVKRIKKNKLTVDAVNANLIQELQDIKLSTINEYFNSDYSDSIINLTTYH